MRAGPSRDSQPTTNTSSDNRCSPPAGSSPCPQTFAFLLGDDGDTSSTRRHSRRQPAPGLRSNREAVSAHGIPQLRAFSTHEVPQARAHGFPHRDDAPWPTPSFAPSAVRIVPRSRSQSARTPSSARLSRSPDARSDAPVYVATQAMVFHGAQVGDGARLGAGCIVHTRANIPDRSRVVCARSRFAPPTPAS